MIKFIELTEGMSRILIQVGDVRMIKPDKEKCYIFFTDGSHIFVQESYEYICAMLCKTLT